MGTETSNRASKAKPAEARTAVRDAPRKLRPGRRRPRHARIGCGLRTKAPKRWPPQRGLGLRVEWGLHGFESFFMMVLSFSDPRQGSASLGWIVLRGPPGPHPLPSVWKSLLFRPPPPPLGLVVVAGKRDQGPCQDRKKITSHWKQRACLDRERKVGTAGCPGILRAGCPRIGRPASFEHSPSGERTCTDGVGGAAPAVQAIWTPARSLDRKVRGAGFAVD